MHILFLTQTTEQGASSRARVYEWLPFLEKEGYKYSVKPGVPYWLDKMYLTHPTLLIKVCWFLCKIFSRMLTIPQLYKYDLVFLQRETIPYFYPLVDLLIIRFSRKTLFDFDDAIFVYYKKVNFLKKWLFDSHSAIRIIKKCDAILVSNNWLADIARKYNQQVSVIPTCIKMNDIQSGQNLDKKPIIIGWIGSPSTLVYIESVLPAIKVLAQKYTLVLRLVGVLNYHAEGINIECCPWSKETERYELEKFHIGIMPLPENSWTLGKGGYKLLQYLSAGVPSVASPVGMNCEIIRDGENGFLASLVDEWINKVNYLITDHSLRLRFAQNGRITINNFYTYNVNARFWIDAISRTIGVIHE